jgi:hypothetical protein
MTEPLRQRILLRVSDARAVLRRKGAGQDEGQCGDRRAVGAGAAGQAPPDPGPAAVPDRLADLAPRRAIRQAVRGGSARGRRSCVVMGRDAVHGRNLAGRTAQLPPGPHVIPGPRREDAAQRPRLSIHDRDDVVVVSLRGEPDLLGASVPADLSYHPSGSRPRGVAGDTRGRSRVIWEVSMSHGSAVAADRGPHHGDGVAPAPGWLS